MFLSPGTGNVSDGERWGVARKALLAFLALTYCCVA